MLRGGHDCHAIGHPGEHVVGDRTLDLDRHRRVRGVVDDGQALVTRPSAVRSKTKSMDQTWFAEGRNSG